MAKFVVAINYETSKTAVSEGSPVEVADDRDFTGAVVSAASRLIKKAIDQGALNNECPLQIVVKRV